MQQQILLLADSQRSGTSVSYDGVDRSLEQRNVVHGLLLHGGVARVLGRLLARGSDDRQQTFELGDLVHEALGERRVLDGGGDGAGIVDEAFLVVRDVTERLVGAGNVAGTNGLSQTVESVLFGVGGVHERELVRHDAERLEHASVGVDLRDDRAEVLQLVGVGRVVGDGVGGLDGVGHQHVELVDGVDHALAAEVVVDLGGEVAAVRQETLVDVLEARAGLSHGALVAALGGGREVGERLVVLLDEVVQLGLVRIECLERQRLENVDDALLGTTVRRVALKLLGRRHELGHHALEAEEVVGHVLLARALAAAMEVRAVLLGRHEAGDQGVHVRDRLVQRTTRLGVVGVGERAVGGRQRLGHEHFELVDVVEQLLAADRVLGTARARLGHGREVGLALGDRLGRECERLGVALRGGILHLVQVVALAQRLGEELGLGLGEDHVEEAIEVGGLAVDSLLQLRVARLSGERRRVACQRLGAAVELAEHVEQTGLACTVVELGGNLLRERRDGLRVLEQLGRRALHLARVTGLGAGVHLVGEFALAFDGLDQREFRVREGRIGDGAHLRLQRSRALVEQSTRLGVVGVLDDVLGGDDRVRQQALELVDVVEYLLSTHGIRDLGGLRTRQRRQRAVVLDRGLGGACERASVLLLGRLVELVNVLDLLACDGVDLGARVGDERLDLLDDVAQLLVLARECLACAGVLRCANGTVGGGRVRRHLALELLREPQQLLALGRVGSRVGLELHELGEARVLLLRALQRLLRTGRVALVEVLLQVAHGLLLLARRQQNVLGVGGELGALKLLERALHRGARVLEARVGIVELVVHVVQQPRRGIDRLVHVAHVVVDLSLQRGVGRVTQQLVRVGDQLVGARVELARHGEQLLALQRRLGLLRLATQVLGELLGLGGALAHGAGKVARRRASIAAVHVGERRLGALGRFVHALLVGAVHDLQQPDGLARHLLDRVHEARPALGAVGRRHQLLQRALQLRLGAVDVHGAGDDLVLDVLVLAVLGLGQRLGHVRQHLRRVRHDADALRQLRRWLRVLLLQCDHHHHQLRDRLRQRLNHLLHCRHHDV